MSRYTPLLLACLLLARPSQSFSDPTFIGSKYLISSEATGDYLTCGTDTLCSMQPLSGAHETDGWTMLSTDSYWQFIGNDGSWALDVQNSVQSFQQQTGEKVFANTETDVEPNLDQGQLWSLIPWPDGSYQLQNIGWSNGALDVDEGVTPFVNTVNSDSSLTGQYWYFLSVQPQVTTTVFTTSTQTVNTLAATTVTVTTTVCPNKRAHVNGTPLYKRQATGSAILDTTTTTVTSTITSTTTQIGATILTSTDIVTSCAPTVTQIQTQTQVSQSVATATNTVVSISTTGGGSGLTAGAPGIAKSQSQTAPASTATNVKTGGASGWGVDIVRAIVFLGIAAIGPRVLF